MPEYFYLGAPLSSYSLWELGQVEKSLKEALAKREEIKDHPKLVKRNIKLPPPNVEFLKLKDAIEAEIRNRQRIFDIKLLTINTEIKTENNNA